MTATSRGGRSYGTAVTALVVAASIAVSVTAFRSTPAAAQTGSHCVTAGAGLSEQTMNYYFTGASATVPVQNVGETLIYHDNIYDADNQVVGHAVGFVSAVYKRPSDGHLMTQYYETVQLPDGSISDSGLNDRYTIFSGGVAHFHAIGTSGRYLGKTGTRDWQLIPPVAVPPRPDQRGRFTYVMCD